MKNKIEIEGICPYCGATDNEIAGTLHRSGRERRWCKSCNHRFSVGISVEPSTMAKHLLQILLERHVPTDAMSALQDRLSQPRYAVTYADITESAYLAKLRPDEIVWSHVKKYHPAEPEPQGLTTKQIADRYSSTPRAIVARAQRIRKKLKEQNRKFGKKIGSSWYYTDEEAAQLEPKSVGRPPA